MELLETDFMLNMCKDIKSNTENYGREEDKKTNVNCKTGKKPRITRIRNSLINLTVN